MFKYTEEKLSINRLLCGNTAHSCKASYIKLAIKALENQIKIKKMINDNTLDIDKIKELYKEE